MVSNKTLYMHLYIDGRNPFTQWLMEYQIYMLIHLYKKCLD